MAALAGLFGGAGAAGAGAGAATGATTGAAATGAATAGAASLGEHILNAAQTKLPLGATEIPSVVSSLGGAATKIPGYTPQPGFGEMLTGLMHNYIGEKSGGLIGFDPQGQIQFGKPEFSKMFANYLQDRAVTATQQQAQQQKRRF